MIVLAIGGFWGESKAQWQPIIYPSFIACLADRSRIEDLMMRSRGLKMVRTFCKPAEQNL